MHPVYELLYIDFWFIIILMNKNQIMNYLNVYLNYRICKKNLIHEHTAAINIQLNKIK